MKKLIHIALILFICFGYACQNQTDKNLKMIPQEELIVDPFVESNVLLLADENDYKIILQKVEKAEYDSLSSKYNRLDTPTPLLTIYDADSILTALRNLGVGVDTLYMADDPSTGAVKKIIAKNGIEREYQEYDYPFLVAYYPEYFMLLLEGGHSTEMGVNVATGEDVFMAGNPATQTFSPSKRFRLSSIYNGQECSTFVLQEKAGKDYIRVALIGERYEFCNYSASFWKDDYTLYLEIMDAEDPYYKLLIQPKS